MPLRALLLQGQRPVLRLRPEPLQQRVALQQAQDLERPWLRVLLLRLWELAFQG